MGTRIGSVVLSLLVLGMGLCALAWASEDEVFVAAPAAPIAVAQAPIVVPVAVAPAPPCPPEALGVTREREWNCLLLQ